MNNQTSSKATKLGIGKKVSEGVVSWRGADLTSSFSFSISTEDIKRNIENQGVGVVELEEIPLRHNRFKSYKLCIHRKDIDLIKDKNFWPEGIVIRRFYFPRGRDGDGVAIRS